MDLDQEVQSLGAGLYADPSGIDYDDQSAIPGHPTNAASTRLSASQVDYQDRMSPLGQGSFTQGPTLGAFDPREPLNSQLNSPNFFGSAMNRHKVTPFFL